VNDLQDRSPPSTGPPWVQNMLISPDPSSISPAVTREFVDGLADDARIIDDPPALSGVSPDPDDDYLRALARAANADYPVSGDRHLLELDDPEPPVLTPRQSLDLLDA
jgi:predicted nucleic acid-binding protein